MDRNIALTVALVGAAFLAGLAVAQTATQTGREPQFENSSVKVGKSLVLPNNPLPLHRHEHPRVIIACAGNRLISREKLRRIAR
jgi:hypothetical protein